jgi:aerobic carbon-monoxide dehydrogenase medium subunit
MQLTDGGDFLSVTPSELPPFHLARPKSLEAVVEALGALPAPVTLHSGGTDLFARFRAGWHPASLISLGGVSALRHATVRNDCVELGAGLTHRAAVAHPAVAAVPGLAQAWTRIASVRIRHTGTLGGNLMARHPRYELSILMSALGAEARLIGPAGQERRLPVERLWDTDVSTTPLLVSVVIPRAGQPQIDYERGQRPRFTQALCKRTGTSGARFRLVVATEWLQPWITDFSPDDPADEVLSRLPEEFSDVAIRRDYLVRAGAIYLRRQLERLETAS